MTVGGRSDGTSARIMEAARARLLADGYARLSTRAVAEAAGVPLSQIHYHFGSKHGLVLALLDHENRRLVDRQRDMYAADAPLWKRYEQACDFLDDDLASGFVRVLQEMIAAGWSDDEVARQVVNLLRGWFDVLAEVAREAERRFGRLGPFTAEDIAGLVGLSFLGGEAVVLLGDEQWGLRVRSWLRSVGGFLRQVEQA
jgi:AcrR family transcriptional regulator